MHVDGQALLKEVLACSNLNLRQQMFLEMLFASQGDLQPGVEVHFSVICQHW